MEFSQTFTPLFSFHNLHGTIQNYSVVKRGQDMKPLKNPPSSVLPKTAAILLRKLIRTIAKQPKNILGLLLFNYLNQSKKTFLFS